MIAIRIMHKKAITYVFLLLFLVGNMDGVVVVAQNNNQLREDALETRSFDETVWQKLNEELDYSGEAARPKPLEEQKEQEAFNFDGFTLSPFMQFLLISILIALLAWLVYNIITASEQNPFATKAKTDEEIPEVVTLERLEAELDKNEVLPLLSQAEQDKNYHLAVRLHFLALLKKLHTNGNIRWKKDLTNSAYLQQMQAQSSYPAFQSLTHTFERVWYGLQIPDEAEYKRIKSAFHAFSPEAKTLKPAADE